MTKKIEKLIDTCPRCGGHEFRIPEYICDKCKWQDPSCVMTKDNFIAKEIENFEERFELINNGCLECGGSAFEYNGEEEWDLEKVKSFIRDSEKRLILEIKKEMPGEKKLEIEDSIDPEIEYYKRGFNSCRAEVMKVLDKLNEL